MIPADIRRQFQTDTNGRVLFFTAPPLNSAPIKSRERLGHSAKYLAWKIKREEELAALKRKRESQNGETEATQEEAKRRKLQAEVVAKSEETRAKNVAAALKAMGNGLADALIGDYKRRFGDRWKEEMQQGLEDLEALQKHAAKEKEELLKAKKELEKRRMDGLVQGGLLGDLVP
jgi:chromatin structure-remodeling complex subunit RSC1/2